MTPAPDVRSFPPEDEDFAQLVHHLAHEFGGPDGARGRLLSDVLEFALRTFYPDVRVRCREPLAGFETEPLVLYAFRDGTLLSRDEAPGAERASRPLEALLRRSVSTYRESRRALRKASLTAFVAQDLLERTRPRRGIEPH